MIRCSLIRLTMALPALLLPVLVSAAGAAEALPPARPKVALVLSGGGARGAAHVGVIRQLEELRIPVDLVVGTSMGSVVGSLYSSGCTADELQAVLENADWFTIFSDAPPREELWFRRRQDDRSFQVDLELGWKDGGVVLPPGFIIGLNMEAFLEQQLLPVVSIQRFDALPIPFRCVATDALTGKPVVFDQDSVATAVRASMSIPGVFAPVVYQGRTLIDGGVVDNLPIRLAQDLGADVVIAVDIADSGPTDISGLSAMGVFSQMLGILMQTNRRESLAALRASDLLISPDVSAIGLMEFERYPEAIAGGYQAAAAMSPRLAALGVEEAEYRRWREAVRATRPRAPLVRTVRVDGASGLSDAVIEGQIAILPGAPLSGAALKTTREQIAGLGIFQHVEIGLEPVAAAPGQAEATDVVIMPVEKSWGRNYFRFGLGVSSDLQGQGEFDVGVQHTWTPLNNFGGEWRNELQIGTRGRVFTEFYQPVDHGLRWFAAPYAQYEYDSVPIIIDREPVAEYDADSFEFGLHLGRNLGYWGEIRTGYGWTSITAEPRIVPPGYARDTIHGQQHIAETRLTVDTFDSATLPATGFFGELVWTVRREDLTYGDDKSVLSTNLSAPLTFGPLTLLGSLEGGSALSGDPSFGNEFYLGGFRRLSGFAPREISGDHLLLGVLQAYCRLGRRTTMFGLAPFVGGTLEAGNVWQTRDQASLHDLDVSGSLYLGAETFIGQSYLGCGYAEGDNLALYVFIGPTF